MKRSGTLGIGLALCVIAAAIALAPSSGALVAWLVRLWPVLPILVGMASLVGFALKRQPRRPWFGALLITIGALALPVTLQATSNPLVLFGRYWPVMVVVVAFVEVLRQYTHRPEMGERPPLFSAGKVALVGVIAVAGLGANRLAETNPNVLANTALPKWVGNVRDDLFGEEFTFEPVLQAVQLPTSGVVSVSNRFGDLTVEAYDGSMVEVQMTPTVRAYDRESAATVVQQLALSVVAEDQVVSVSTNRDAVEHRFTTNLRVRIPKSAGLRVDQSHGTVVIAGLESGASGITVNGTYSSLDLHDLRADVTVKNNNQTVTATRCSGALEVDGRSDVTVTAHAGNILLTDSDSVNLSGVTTARVELRSVDRARVTMENIGLTASDVAPDPAAPLAEVLIAGEHTRVTLKSIRANVRVQTTHEDIRATGITGKLDIEASHSRVDVAGAGALTVKTDHENVKAKDIAGPVVVETDHSEVNVTEFRGALSVRTSFERVRLAAARTQTGDVIVENERGSVDVRLPADRLYRFETTGDVRVDPSFGRVADGATPPYRVSITTSDNEDITIRPVVNSSSDGDPA